MSDDTITKLHGFGVTQAAVVLMKFLKICIRDQCSDNRYSTVRCYINSMREITHAKISYFQASKKAAAVVWWLMRRAESD